MGDRLINYAAAQSPALIIPKVLGAGAFGVYAFALMIVGQPVIKICAALTKALFPGLSKIQREPERFAAAFVAYEKWIFAAAAPAMAGMAILAPEILRVIFSEKRLDSASVMPAVCLYGALLAIGTTNGAALFALGRGGMAMAGNAIAAALLPPVVWGACAGGIAAAAWARAVFLLAVYLAWIFALRTISAIRPQSLLRAYAPAAASCAIMGAAVAAARAALLAAEFRAASALAICVALGAAVYAAAYALFDPHGLRELRAMISPKRPPKEGGQS
ncbi:MAG: Lipopolysaccharide biosynthesis protein WzxC [candidate division BRC1 bacterium ADurb.BinA364]|nr:MAG: Lipopolysaccharide biosynthesis protein WzxC [candidate division BRC1 bacterium ADurb.BinA364]